MKCDWCGERATQVGIFVAVGREWFPLCDADVELHKIIFPWGFYFQLFVERRHRLYILRIGKLGYINVVDGRPAGISHRIPFWEQHLWHWPIYVELWVDRFA